MKQPDISMKQPFWNNCQNEGFQVKPTRMDLRGRRVARLSVTQPTPRSSVSSPAHLSHRPTPPAPSSGSLHNCIYFVSKQPSQRKLSPIHLNHTQLCTIRFSVFCPLHRFIAFQIFLTNIQNNEEFCTGIKTRGIERGSCGEKEISRSATTGRHDHAQSEVRTQKSKD
mmetsp:Transcript_10634/g.39673  ORF Transcript_10634/g.39673 Transcript_10634/m.39673 type:complete len:168 (-) Transcript_10634:5990-6493(-)